MIKVNLIQKLASVFVPIKIWKGSSKVNPVLEIFLYRGQWQLGTADALYSTGTRYRPLIIGFENIKNELFNIKTVLVLGAGLGSAPAILSKMGHQPVTTLVDIDEEVIRWTKSLTDDKKDQLKFIVENAEFFMGLNTLKYDLVIVDIFNGRLVPKFVSELGFLENCRKSVNEKGYLIANYMIPSSEEWQEFYLNFTKVFSSVEIKEIGINRVLIAKV